MYKPNKYNIKRNKNKDVAIVSSKDNIIEELYRVSYLTVGRIGRANKRKTWHVDSENTSYI